MDSSGQSELCAGALRSQFFPNDEYRSVYVGCADPEAEGDDFLNATWRVRYVEKQLLVELSLTSPLK